ncbi:MAG: ATP-binding protein [Candidatus Krumholzibacteriia bacterium]
MATRTARHAAIDVLLREVSAECARGQTDIESDVRVASAMLTSVARSTLTANFVASAAGSLEEAALLSSLGGLAAEYADTVQAVGVVAPDGRAVGMSARYDGGEMKVVAAALDTDVANLMVAADAAPGHVIQGRTLDDRAGRLAPLVASVPAGGHVWLLLRLGAVAERVAETLHPSQNAMTFITDREGVVVYARDDAMRSLVLPELAPDWSGVADGHPRSPASIVRDAGGRKFAVARVSAAYPGWSIVVAVPLASVTNAIDRAAVHSLLLMLVAVAVALAAVTLVTRRIVRNLEVMAESAMRVASGDLETRVGLVTGDEIEDLSRVFDEMTCRLRESRRALVASTRELAEKVRLAELGQFAAVIAHELRNPLGIVRVAASSLGSVPNDSDEARRLKKILADEIDRLDHTLHRLLQYAHREPPRLLDLDLRVLVRDLAESLATEFDAHGVRLVVDVPTETVPIAADPDQFRGALLNLLLNARQASPEGRTVRILVSSVDGMARVDVVDQGAGIPESLRERLFQPFASGRQGGIGLGLANAHTVVQAHGGTVSLDDGPDGGTRAVITLPLRGYTDRRTNAPSSGERYSDHGARD